MELEIKAVSQFLNSLSLDSVKCISSDEIDSLAIDFDYILSFEFRLGGTNTAYLSEMDEYLRTKAASEQDRGANSKMLPWYNDGSKKRAIQIKAKLFKEFAQINSTRNDITFVVHIVSDTPSPSKEGAAVILYADSEPAEFDLPSKPTHLHIMKATSEEVHLAWSKPKYGQGNVFSYVVSFHPINMPSNQIMERTKIEKGDESLTIVVQDLVPRCEYKFTVQAQCIAGLSPKSEAVMSKTPKRQLEESVSPSSKKQKMSTSNTAEEQMIVPVDRIKSEQPMDVSPPPAALGVQTQMKSNSDNMPATNTNPIVLTLPPSYLSQQMQLDEPIELTMQTKMPQYSTADEFKVVEPPASVSLDIDTNPQPDGVDQQRLTSNLPQKMEECIPRTSFPVPCHKEGPDVSARMNYEQSSNASLLEPYDSAQKTPTTNFEETLICIEKPKPRNVSYKSIGLEWKRPSVGNSTVQYYTVLYHTDTSAGDTLNVKKTEGAEEHITVDGLSSETGYIFRIQTTFSSGLMLESKSTGVIKTKAHLAETIRLKSKLISKKTSRKPAIYELTKKQQMIDHRKKIAKYEVGHPRRRGCSNKVLMVVGAMGAGKTTLINGIANYMYGVQWDDDFRFVLVANEPSRKSQAHSQTSWITAYTLHKGKDSPIPYSLTIVDTPGFGDTEGIARDKKIADQIKDFFSIRPPQGIDILHGIGFVAQASLARLSPSQKYIFDSILSIYGRDVASNIFMMTTFADGQDPPVMDAIAEAKIPHQKYFKFNNSALFVTG